MHPFPPAGGRGCWSLRHRRRDLHDAEAALRDNDIDAFRVAVEDASGAAGELFGIADATIDSQEG